MGRPFSLSPEGKPDLFPDRHAFVYLMASGECTRQQVEADQGLEIRNI